MRFQALREIDIFDGNKFRIKTADCLKVAPPKPKLAVADRGKDQVGMSPAGLNAATMGGVKSSHPEWVGWS
jgi:hypothetical protein